MTERADFLTRIVDRTLERVPVIEPREVSLYETRHSSGMTSEPLDVASVETTERAGPEDERAADARDGEHSRAQLVPREPPGIGEAQSRHASALPAQPTAPVSVIHHAAERVQETRAQTHIHHLIHEQQPALAPRTSAARLQPAEKAERSVIEAAAAQVEERGSRPRKQRADAPDAPPDEQRTATHQVFGQTVQTEALLPRQSLVRDVMARSAAEPSQSHEPSSSPETASDTVVNVTIGRVEVRAGMPQQKAPTQARRTNAHQPMSLTEYLQKRGSPR